MDVIFVVHAADDEETEVTVASSTIANVSDVWRERLEVIAPPDKAVRCKETASVFEVKSFVGVCTLMSPHPTMPSLLRRPGFDLIDQTKTALGALTAALTLCHKYDCRGLVSVIVHLAEPYFPNFILSTSRQGETPSPISRWLTQQHLDYILRVQELFDGDEVVHLNDVQLSVLSHALTSGIQWTNSTRFANGIHFEHGKVEVIDTPIAGQATAATANGVSSSTYDSSTSMLHLFLEPLILDKSRLTAATLLRLLPKCLPRQAIAVSMDMEHRRGSTSGHLASAKHMTP